MPDKWSKSNPWRARITRDAETVMKLVPIFGGAAVDSCTVPVSAGERMFKTQRAAEAFVAAWRADHGADIVTDVYRAA